VTRYQRLRAHVLRRPEQVVELDRLVALDAGNRRLTPGISRSKVINHGLAKALRVIEHIVRNADVLRRRPRVLDILARTAGPLALGRPVRRIKLQRDAHDIIARALDQRRRYRTVDTTGHGRNNTRPRRISGQVHHVADLVDRNHARL
jgi:hypothetical protein